jgi:energy-coupling factor transporter ATP-binding protein EcfA2
MALELVRVTAGPLQNFSISAPDGVAIGIIGENGSGKSRLLRLAAGEEEPTSGKVQRSGPARLLGPDAALDFPRVAVLLLDGTFARHDALLREQAAMRIESLRRQGTTILLVSHEEELVRRLCDEVWWLCQGRLAGRGDPIEILPAYRRHIAARFRAWGENAGMAVAPLWRCGDGRAEILGIETLSQAGRPTGVWRSGELAVVRVRIRFRDPVAEPVIGIMIRARGGLNVYGTNTELEHLKVGPCAAGDSRELTFAFRCDLCPENYTLTVASHDPAGVWHDWLEDAVSFAVTDDRYTAGVANLRATVTLTGLEPA